MAAARPMTHVRGNRADCTRLAAASTVEISLATVRRTRAGPPIQLGRCGNLQVRFPGIISTLSGRFVNGPVGQQRFSIGRSADCDVVVADDGLQHLALARDCELVLIDGVRGFGNGLLLPAGPLRERTARLRTVDAIILLDGTRERMVRNLKLSPSGYGSLLRL